MSFLLVTPIACGERVAEPVGNGPGLDGQLQVEVLPFVDELLGVHPHLLQNYQDVRVNKNVMHSGTIIVICSIGFLRMPLYFLILLK